MALALADSLTSMIYYSFLPSVPENIQESVATSSHDLVPRLFPPRSSRRQSVNALATPTTVQLHNRSASSPILPYHIPPDPSSSMSRPAIGHRPNHITLPTGPFVGRSPNESPAATPTGGMASPTSPRNSFLPNFMSIRQRARAATLSTSTGNSQRVATSPGAEIGNPLATRNGHEASGAGVTRTVSTPATGVLTNGHGNAVNGE